MPKVDVRIPIKPNISNAGFQGNQVLLTHWRKKKKNLHNSHFSLSVLVVDLLNVSNHPTSTFHSQPSNIQRMRIWVEAVLYRILTLSLYMSVVMA